jgi:hypothetical protein
MRLMNAGSGTHVAASGDAHLVGTPVSVGRGAGAADDARADDELGDAGESVAPSGESAGRGEAQDATDATDATSATSAKCTTNPRTKNGEEQRTALRIDSSPGRSYARPPRDRATRTRRTRV